MWVNVRQWTVRQTYLPDFRNTNRSICTCQLSCHAATSVLTRQQTHTSVHQLIVHSHTSTKQLHTYWRDFVCMCILRTKGPIHAWICTSPQASTNQSEGCTAGCKADQISRYEYLVPYACVEVHLPSPSPPPPAVRPVLYCTGP